MLKYILGFLINFFNFKISKLTLIDDISVVGKNTRIYSNCQIFNSNIGSYTYISRKTSIVHAVIGSFCSIANNVKIGMGQHKIYSISSSPLFYSKNNALGISFVEKNDFLEFERVNIGNDVWIGTGAMIMSGVNVGNGAVIGAGAIVTKDIPDYAIVVGVPGKIIKYRFNKEVIKYLVESKWWNWSEEIIKDNIHLFKNNELTEELLKSLKQKSN